MDKIHIKNLEVFARHGVFPEENALGQKFVVSAVLYTSTREAGRADDLAKSIHYGEVSRFITEFMEQNTFQLLETAAERLALSADSGARRAGGRLRGAQDGRGQRLLAAVGQHP